MRLARTAAVVGVALLTLAVGPVVLLVAAGALAVPRLRARLRPSRRRALGWAGAVAALTGLALVVPDGWLPIPPGPGAMATPAYLGRPFGTGPVLGPLGESPRVTSRSFGVTSCRRVEVDDRGRLVTLCDDRETPVLRVLDAGTLRQRAAKQLPASRCPAAFAVDRQAGAAAVATGDGRLLTVATADAEGDLDLTTTAAADLRLEDGECVVGVAAAAGRLWFATTEGRVGVVEGREVRSAELGDRVGRPPVAAGGTAYVVGARGLHRLDLDGRGTPSVSWSSGYDEGERGSAPVLLPGGLVALADDRRPRLQVVVHRADTGAVVCRQEVFGDGGGSTDGGLVAVGGDLLVTNAHGYAGPLSTVLGRTTTGGVARIDVAPSGCRVAWTSDLDAPSGTPAVSVADGLAYLYTKRRSWVGVDAWYLTAVDLRTGRVAWARRTGLGVLRDNHHGDVTLGPGAAAYVPVLGGFVRVRDRD
jgi:hypothetical protein